MTRDITVGVLILALILGLLYSVYQLGRIDGLQECRLTAATQANNQWAQRFTLESQLATRDAQLAEAQQAASVVRHDTVTKREVVYRDRIKTITVRNCIDDSGLWDLYNASLGLTGGKQ